MRKLTFLVAAVAFVALQSMGPPPVDDLVLGQSRCRSNTAICLGDKNNKTVIGGNISVSSPDGGFSVSETGAVTAPSITSAGSNSYTGTNTFGTVKADFVDAGVLNVAGAVGIAGNLTLAGKVPVLRADILDAGLIYAQGTGPIVRILPFTTAAIDFASGTIVCVDSAGTTVTGARTGDPCFVGMPSTLTAGGTGLHHSYTCYVSAADTIKIRACAAGTADDPGSVVFQGYVISQTQ